MTIESLTTLALDFITRNEFKKIYPKEYSKVIRTKGWRNIVFNHMEWVASRDPNRPNITDTEALSKALSCNTIKELREKDYGVYCYIKKNKHLKLSAYNHMTTLRKKQKYQIPKKHNKGLYFLFQDDVIVYVGKSITNITNRLNTHTTDKKFNYIEIYSMTNESDIAIMEMYFIVKHKPIYNKESQSIDITTIVIPNFEKMYTNKYTSSN